MSYISSLRQSNPAILADENWRKAWACVPVVGIMFSWTQEVTMTERMFEATPQEKIALIDVNTKYRVCDIIRNGLTAVLAVIAVVAGILPPLGLVLACIYTGLGALYAYGSISNNRELQLIADRLARVEYLNRASQAAIHLGL